MSVVSVYGLLCFEKGKGPHGDFFFEGHKEKGATLRLADARKLAALVRKKASPDLALTIPDGNRFGEQVKELLAKAGLTEGYIELMPLRSFDTYYDEAILPQLKAIPGFTFSIYDAAEEERLKREAASMRNAGINFF